MSPHPSPHRPPASPIDAAAGPLDPRLHAYREDVADSALAARVQAARFADPIPMQLAVPREAVRNAAGADAIAVSELLRGEAFHVVDEQQGWAWGWCGHDHYVGHVRAAALEPVAPATHWISAPAALVFAQASIKAPVIAELPMGARVSANAEGDRFVALAGSGFVHRCHVAAIGEGQQSDWVEAARSFIGAPYQWGGRTRHGIDCSGLVQMALLACGIPCPRDSDMQRDGLGRPADAPQRGDLIFFPGHVGIMTDDAYLLHANAFWMQTVIEPLVDVIDRLRADHAEPVTAIKRL